MATIDPEVRSSQLRQRYGEVRDHTEDLAAPLSPEDQMVQSMPDVSPTKWHRGHTTCGWKGVASYFDVVVDGERAAAAAWYYPDPKEAAMEIKDRISFWRGVEVGR